MKIRCFRRGYRNGWEINLIGRVWNLRIARHQVALWKDQRPVFNFLDAAEHHLRGVPAMLVLALVAIISCSPAAPTPVASTPPPPACTINITNNGDGGLNVNGCGNVTNTAPSPQPSTGPAGDNEVASFAIFCYGFGTPEGQPEPNHNTCALPPGYPNIAVTASPKNSKGVDIGAPGDITDPKVIDWTMTVSPPGGATLNVQASNRFNATVAPASPRVDATFILTATYTDAKGGKHEATKAGSIQK